MQETSNCLHRDAHHQRRLLQSDHEDLYIWKDGKSADWPKFKDDFEAGMYIPQTDQANFYTWRSDMSAAWPKLRAEFRVDIQDFDSRYEGFKLKLGANLDDVAQANTELAPWELRFHIARIWDRL